MPDAKPADDGERQHVEDVRQKVAEGGAHERGVRDEGHTTPDVTAVPLRRVAHAAPQHHCRHTYHRRVNIAISNGFYSVTSYSLIV